MSFGCHTWALFLGLRYTGGTIGMLKGPDGSLRPEPGALRQRLQKLEELNQVRKRCLLSFK